MCVYLLLNVLNMLWKKDKMQGLQSILSYFSNEFNKFINKGPQILDPISVIYERFINIGYFYPSCMNIVFCLSEHPVVHLSIF